MITPLCPNKIGKRFQRLAMGCVLLSMLVWVNACQKSEPHSANANSASTNTAVSSTSASPAASTQAEVKTEAPTSPDTISLATPTDTYKTGYSARKNKDIGTLKRVMSKNAQAFLTEMAGIDKKTLDDLLKELADKPQAPSAETRNEKINGNRATLEYLDEEGKWVVMDFSKEGNEWKIDLPEDAAKGRGSK